MLVALCFAIGCFYKMHNVAELEPRAETLPVNNRAFSVFSQLSTDRFHFLVLAFKKFELPKLPFHDEWLRRLWWLWLFWGKRCALLRMQSRRMLLFADRDVRSFAQKIYSKLFFFSSHQSCCMDALADCCGQCCVGCWSSECSQILCFIVTFITLLAIIILIVVLTQH